MACDKRLMVLPVVVLALASLLPCGCARPKTVQEPSPLASTDTTPSPGIVKLEDDQVLAIGTFVYERSHKRFALVNAGPESRLTGKERVIASVGESAQTDGDLVGLVGAYVELRGKALESTSSAFPELSIVSIRIISLPSDRGRAAETTAAK